MNKKAIPLELRRHKLVAVVRRALKDQDIVVGVSGGADSVALLLLCCAAVSQKTSNFRVYAAHINHGLREEAHEEQQMVIDLCKRLDVRCEVRKISVEPLKGSVAAGARKARYEQLFKIAKKLEVQSVAVAHHAADQLETMLIALCRGGGLKRLAGMNPSRPLGENVSLIRPLLHIDKQLLEEICQLAKIKWCNDPTNNDLTTPRGRLRRDVIPVLHSLWPAADKHAANASTILQAATDTFESFVPNGTQWSRKKLSQHPIPIIAAAVHGAVGEYATFDTVQSIASAVADDVTDPRAFTCGEGCIATVTAHHVEIVYT
ncbi:MAG: tRNA lysidine(34) synthetase TilS [Planctomycetota bacterium]|nr:tRNA lysidine(34) synthetase TilS [Planctomycetota bacterium]